MRDVLISALAELASTLRTRASLQIEILALRHQLGVLQRTERRRLRPGASDRLPWVALFRFRAGLCRALMLVKPETVIGWHRGGFRFYRKWKSRRERMRRPKTAKEIRELIRSMSKANLLWGAPRPHGELLKLGIEVSQATVAQYMVKRRKPPSQTFGYFEHACPSTTFGHSSLKSLIWTQHSASSHGCWGEPVCSRSTLPYAHPTSDPSGFQGLKIGPR